MDEPHRRKLAVILHADIVGSTTLVQRDEALAHGRIQDSFRRFSETIKTYGGSTHELRGDALVAEFARASDAVCAALRFQQVQSELLLALSDAIKPVVRIGISLGEVIVADNTVTGAGVVLAQRLEQLATAGGVVVQGSVSETVPSRLPFDFEYMGEQSLKGFERPVRAFVARLKPGEQIPDPESNAVVPTAGAGGDEERSPLELPARPSIAVLPFVNMSSDLEQDYFSDGITEDIITELSRFLSFLVIARTSSFTYKNKNTTAKEIAKELKVQFLVEGSVRRSGNRVRITAQLISSMHEDHLWADKFDGDIEDVFEFQDEVVARIAGSIAGRIDAADLERAERTKPEDMQAYDYFLQGQAMTYRSGTGNGTLARDLLTKAIELDNNYARAHATLALAYCIAVTLKDYEDADHYLQLAETHAEIAYQLDQNDSLSQWAMSETALFKREFDRSRQHIDRAIGLNPNDADILAWACMVYTGMGQPREGIEFLDRAISRNPFHPDWYLWLRGFACCAAGFYEQAIDTTDRVGKPHVGVLKVRAVAFVSMGRLKDARRAVERILEIEPEISITNSPRMFKEKKDFDKWLYGLRLAGLPE